MRRLLILAWSALLLAHAGAGAAAAACAKEDFAQAVDRAGAALRKLNADNAPKLQAKLRQLMERRGWSDSTAIDKAFEAVHDERIAAFDNQANDLLAKIDTLGTVGPGEQPDCAKLQDLTASSLELQATVKAKTAYTLAKIDQMLAVSGEAKLPPVAKTPDVVAKAPDAKPPAPKPAPQKAPDAKPPIAKAPDAKAPAAGPWSTTTRGERDVALAPPPGPRPEPGIHPGAPAVEDEGYTIDEIKAVSEGLFGKLTANLAAVIEHVFKNSGRPMGYIVGTEGGGAFLAGVRYGKGTLYLRGGGSQPIYWHGPTLGTDVGADGSKTLFLVYRIQSPDQLYTSFTGIDGSAFLVGGVGATLVTNGTLILAPIRSGVGLRLGANIGYIRFTPRATWNPF